MGFDKPPAMLLQITPHGIAPYGAHSPAMLADMPNGQVMTAKPRKGRTLPRNGAYWAGLNSAIENSDAWPTTQHLHVDLKKLCGYVEHYTSPLTGREEIRVQSTAFDKMSEAEFAAYFRLAQMKFTQIMGFDPWSREATQ
jgi:hypothetical protein